MLFDVSNVCAQEQLLCSDGLTDMVRYLCFIHQLGCSTSGSWNKQWSVRFVRDAHIRDSSLVKAVLVTLSSPSTDDPYEEDRVLSTCHRQSS